MGKIIVKAAVVREPGYLYYINGNGDLCSAKMARRGKAAKAVEVKKAIEPKKAVVTKAASKKKAN